MPRVMLILPTETYRATAFLRAAEELGLQVVVASNEAPTLATLMEGRVLTFDLHRPAESAGRAKDFAARWPIDAVVGVDEASVITAANIAERLGVNHRNPIEAVEATRDKRKLRRRLTAAGLVQPRVAEIDVDADERTLDAAVRRTGLPCVVKPVDLAASRGVIRADSRADVGAAVHRVGVLLRSVCTDELSPPMIIESYVDGREIAVEGLVTDGHLEVIALFDKPDPLTGPFFEESIYVTPSRLDSGSQRAAVDAVGAAVAALGLRHGPIHAEIRIPDGDPVVIEVAARSIGGLCSQVIRLACGDAPGEVRSLENVILRQACGLPVGTITLFDSAAGVFMLPVPESGVLRSVAGTDRAMSVAGVTGVVMAVPLNDRLIALPEGDRYLGFIFARGETPQTVEAALRQAQAQLTIDISPAA